MPSEDRARQPVTGVVIAIVVILAVFEIMALLFTLGEAAFRDGSPSGWGFWVGEHAPVRDVLEDIYFVSSVATLLVATFALLMAGKQLKHIADQNRHAENARLAAVYTEIIKRYNDRGLQNSRRAIIAFREAHAVATTSGQTQDSLGAFAQLRLMDLLAAHRRAVIRNPSVETEYARVIKFLDFIEDIGVLVGKNYIDKDAIFEFMAAMLVQTELILRDHIIWNRLEPHGSASTYVNAINLMKDAGDFQDRAYHAVTCRDQRYGVNLN